MFLDEAKENLAHPSFVKTRFAVFIHELLSAPLTSMCLCASFILYKSLSGTPTQVALLTMLRPSVSLLILYWSFSIHSNEHKLMQNLVWSGVLARVPFFIFPWVQNPWVFIACLAIYLFFHRAGTPAWVEIMKMNLPTSQRGKIYSFATALAYAEIFLLSFWINPWLEKNELAWRWLFPLAALIGLTLVFVQKGLPLCFTSPKEKETAKKSWKHFLVKPWKDAYALMKDRPDFRRFQIGFFLCGFGLMMAIAVIPIYSVDILNISYKELLTALFVCQGFGYVLTARVWGHQLSLVPIFRLMSTVILCFILFGVFILLTKMYMQCFYIAYFIYGVAQAGSRLCWNLSGPIFAKEENSAVYSSVNILMVGIRGCVAPFIGTVLCSLYNSYLVLLLFIGISFVAMLLMMKSKVSNLQLAK